MVYYYEMYQESQKPISRLRVAKFREAARVWTVFFLLEQNKEAHALFTSCAMECLLSADCMQFTEGK